MFAFFFLLLFFFLYTRKKEWKEREREKKTYSTVDRKKNNMHKKQQLKSNWHRKKKAQFLNFIKYNYENQPTEQIKITKTIIWTIEKKWMKSASRRGIIGQYPREETRPSVRDATKVRKRNEKKNWRKQKKRNKKEQKKKRKWVECVWDKRSIYMINRFLLFFP